MDFHSLARRDLQFLCKKNRVPANLTNVAMAKALEALETVEGIEEIQEVLGFQSSKVNSPEFPHSGRRTSSRGVTHGEKPKIQQQLSPLPGLHQMNVKNLDITEMASKEDGIQETLGFQSLSLKSPELPRTGRRTSVRRAAFGEEPRIQHQKPSPLYQSRQVVAKDLEVTGMASKEEEGENKEIPTILPKTPATRKAAKGVEARSSNRRANKNKEIDGHTETPMAVEAKGGKAIGVATRRSTRLSSRKALEETATAQPKSRSSSSRENSAVKMEPLAKADTEEQEKEEQKKDRVEYGDSCAVIVEEHGKKDQEAESYEVENECEATLEYVPMIKQQQPSQRHRSHKVITKAQEITKMASEVDDKKKAPKLLLNTRRNTRLSSRKTVEEKTGEQGTVKMVALTEEYAEEQAKQEEEKDLSEKSDSCIADPVEEDEQKDKKQESHGYSSSIDALVEEVEENGKEVEIHGFSSSVLAEDTNIEVQNGDSAVVIVEGDEKSDQELEIQAFSSAIEGEYSNVERKNAEEQTGEQGTVKMLALTEEYAEEQAKQEEEKDLSEKSDSCIADPVEEDVEKDKKQEIHGYSSSIEVEKGESIVALVEEVKENGKEVEISFSALAEDTNNEVENGNSVVIVEGDEKSEQELEIQAFSSTIEGEYSNVERKNDDPNVVLVEKEGRNDQRESSFFVGENSKVKVDEPFESTEDSGHKPLVNDYVKDSSGHSGDQSPNTNLVGESGQANDDVEESFDHSSDAKLTISGVSDSLLCSETRPLLHEAIVCTQGYSKIDEEEEGKLSMLFTELALKEPEETDALLEPLIAQEASVAPTKLPAEMVIPQYADIVVSKDDCSSLDFPSALDIPPLYYENVDAVTNLGNEISVMEAIRESPEEVKESGIDFPRKIAAVSEESIDDDLLDAGELITSGSIDVQGIESRILVFSTELYAEFSAADPTIGFPDEVKESSGPLPTEFPEVIKESFEDNLMDSSELAANDFVGETLEGSFFELQIPVSSSELCPEFSTIDSTIELASVDHRREIPDKSVEDYLHKLAINESFDVPQKTDVSQGQHSSVSCAELCSELSTVDSSIQFKEAFGDLPSEIAALIDESVEADLPKSSELTAENSLQSSNAEINADIDAPTISSTPRPPCQSESMFLEELSRVQTQSSEETTGMAATETKTKALEEEVYLKDENLELLSLTKLRTMYKQILNGTKTEERKKSIIKLEDLERLSSIKHDEDCKQKLNDDMIKSDSKRSVIKQEDLACLSRSKLDSNKQKLNDDKIKSERKRTPLKSLNYSTF